MGDATEPETGAFVLGSWDSGGVSEVSASGEDAEAVVVAGLRAVLAAARGSGRTPTEPEPSGSVAAPIRGQGADLGAVFAELVNDLLAQLDANGAGLGDVRLDGLLRTDDGGYTAWGYVSGASTAAPPPVNVSLDAMPVLAEDSGGLTIRFRLRRERMVAG